MNNKLKKTLQFVGTIVLFLILIYFLEWWGIIGLIIFILSLVMLRCWKERNFLRHIMQQIEMTIFGKPLEKDIWDKREMKNTKIEIIWNSKSKVDWNQYIMMLVYPAIILLFIGVMWDIRSVTIISLVFFSMIIIVKIYYFIKYRWRLNNVKSKEES